MEKENFDFDSISFEELSSTNSTKKTTSAENPPASDFDDGFSLDESLDGTANYEQAAPKNYICSIFLSLCAIGALIITAVEFGFHGIIIGACLVLLALSYKKPKLLILSSAIIAAIIIRDFIFSFLCLVRNEDGAVLGIIAVLTIATSIICLNLWIFKEIKACKIIFIITIVLSILFSYISYTFLGDSIACLNGVMLFRTSVLGPFRMLCVYSAFALRLFIEED